MLRQAMHEAKGVVEMISQITLCLALLPAVLYGLWLILGRPFEPVDELVGREELAKE